MKRFLTILIAALSLSVSAQVQSTPTGAKFTLDSVTTEIMVYSPNAVRVIKYVGARPEVKKLKLSGVARTPMAKEYAHEAGHNKYKLDTGKMYAAINEKDANVSFWSYADTLIMAEQHKTGKIAGKSVSQDFQMGRAKVGELTLRGDKNRRNLKGERQELMDNKKSKPITLDTDKHFSVIWLAEGPTVIDATPRTDKKKEGDITVLTSGSDYIDYIFVAD